MRIHNILQSSRQILITNNSIKYHKNSLRGRHGFPCGQKDGHTDKHDEAKIRSTKPSTKSA